MTDVEIETRTDGHKFEVGQKVWSKSGKRYTIERLRKDHPKLKGELGYSVVGERGGVPFGPVRLMRESAFTEN